jgi:hypothetical protein
VKGKERKGGREVKNAALKVARQYPLVFPVKVGWHKGEN